MGWLKALFGSIYRPYWWSVSGGEPSASFFPSGDGRESLPDQDAFLPYGKDELQGLHSALKTSPTVLYAQDAKLRYAWVYNPRDGYRAQDVLGKTDLDLMPSAVAEPLMAFKQSVLETRQGARQVFEVRNASANEVRYYDLSVEPLVNSQQQVVGITCAATDITDQREAEERERAQRLLAESMVEITTLLKRSLGLDHNLSEVLEEIERAVPYNAANFMIIEDGNARVVSRREGSGVPPLVANSPLELENNLLLKKIRDREQSLVIENVEGNPNWTEGAFAGWIRSYAGLPIRIDDKVTGFLNIARQEADPFLPMNVHYLEGVANKVALAIRNAALVHDLQKALDRAQQADDLRMRLLSTVSHEMRTPLTSIKGFTTTLLADDVTWDEASKQRFLVNIDEEVDKLNELVGQLLDYSRLEAGRLQIRRDRAEMAAIIANVLSQLQIPLARYQVVADCPVRLPSVYADARRIAQVLGNLLRNVTKYVPRETEIRIEALEQGEQVIVRISDQGAGIPKELQKQVFVPFNRGQAEGKVQGGAGLGLAISKRIIEAHDGEIWLERNTDGATFAFSLPIYSTSQKPDESPDTL